MGVKSTVVYLKKSMLCETGKGIGKDTNAAKYNDYLIYDTPGTKPVEEISTAEEQSNPDPVS